jgi:uncharacterized protein DUF4838/cellulose/xylan binding protein with CBM9 domain/glycosyl hydrolase family 67
MKNIARYTYLTLAILTLSGFIGCNSVISKNNNPETIIAKGGKAGVAIVIPLNAPEPVTFAAQELQKYLQEITGSKFEITTDKPLNGKAIFLGEKLGKNAGITLKGVARDGYIIKSVDGNLFIVGKDDSGAYTDIPAKLKVVKKASFTKLRMLMSSSNWTFERGTLYGVYRLLENFGVRWFMAGPKGEVVPNKKSLTFSGEIKEQPHFATRYIGGFLSPFQYSKNHRNRNRDFSELDVMGFTPAANLLWTLRMRGNSMVIPLNHHPSSTDWVERFGKDHPEYFALLENGKRDLDLKKKEYRSHLCYTNPAVERETLKEITTYRAGKTASSIGITKRADRYPYNRGWAPGVTMGKVFSVLPHDSFRACFCPECKKLAAPAGTPYSGIYSKRVWSFVERIARKVKKVHPDQKITCLGYSSYSDPYVGMKPLPDNVIFGFCAETLKRPYELYYKDNFKKFTDLVEKWDAMSEGPMAFWLHMLYRWSMPKNDAVPLHIPKMYKKVVDVMAKHGRWVYIQQNTDSVMYELFNRYMLTKILYNPDADPNALFADYLEKFYGPKAGPIIGNIYADIEKRSEALLTARAGRIDTWNKFYTPETIKSYRTRMNQALKLVADTKYETAVKLFSKYYIGLMEKGQADFDRNIRQAMKAGASKVSFCKLRGPIKIDGVMDEKAWNKPIRRLPLYNNVNGAPTKWKTRVAVTRSKDMLYFGFICDDPKTLERIAGKESVEIFLDPNHNHNSYYQLFITMDGKVTDVYFEGDGEKGNHGWTSNAKVAVKRHKNKWIMEVAIPRSSFPENVTTPTKPWGANICRTMSHPPCKEDSFSTWSRMIRGGFHQPDMFGHLFFVN